MNSNKTSSNNFTMDKGEGEFRTMTRGGDDYEGETV